jgi:glycerophosphoryl diester phosphodiesterase
MGPARPLVIAHRGASADVAEHTLEAYQLAIEVGADGLECDVRLTRDGQLVCIHDRTLERTSTGTGSVSSRRLADLQRLDFGSWHSGRPASVLTLSALLELVHDTPGPPRLLIETKHPTRYGGQVERALVALLERFGWTGGAGGAGAAGQQPVTVMSFAERALRRVNRLAPGLPTVFLMNTSPGLRQSGLLPESAEIAGPGIDLVRSDPGYVERAHLLGNQVYVWTVDDPDDLRLVRELGVDAVITNRPAATVSALTGPV